MDELASAQPGYLGIESVSHTPEPDGDGRVRTITVSYWSDEQSIRAWKTNAEHAVAQRTGRREWYESYTTRVCLVQRQYAFRDDV